MVNLFHVVHAITVSNVGFSAQQVQCRGMDIFQLLFGQVGNAGHWIFGRFVEDAAIEDPQGGDPRVVRDVQRLQSSAGHARDADLGGVQRLMVGAVLVIILDDGPVDGIGQFGGAGALCLLLPVFCGHGADGDDHKTVGGDFVQEVHMLPGGVETGAIAPDHNREFLVALRGDVVGPEQGMCGQ